VDTASIDILNASTNPLAQIATQGLGQTDRADSFADQLARAAGSNDPDQMRKTAEQLVGMTFFLPLLKMARESPFKTELFHGGQGEEAFGAQLDEVLADRLGHRAGNGLVDAIVDKFTRHQAVPTTPELKLNG
jgi:Rod binding domain-containing protein